MHILIVRNNSNSQAQDASLLLVTYLATQGIDYTVVDSSKLASPLAAPELSELFEHGVDMAVALGGDGTILRTARQVGFHGTPILGINYGRLGFLANPNESGVMEPLVAALSGDAAHEVRTNLDIRVVCEGEADPYADDGAGVEPDEPQEFWRSPAAPTAASSISGWAFRGRTWRTCAATAWWWQAPRAPRPMRCRQADRW